MIKIGETLYKYDGNRRIYRDCEGNETSSPYYPYSFKPSKIISETRLSWITANDVKVNKKTMLSNNRGYSPSKWFTHKQMKKDIFRERYAQSIRQKLDGISSKRVPPSDYETYADIYLAIKTILEKKGYDLEPSFLIENHLEIEGEK